MLFGGLLPFGLILALFWPKQIAALKCKVQRYDSRNGHIYMDANGQETCTWDLEPPQNRSDVVIAIRILTFYNKILVFSSGGITLLDGELFNNETSPDKFFCGSYMKANSSCSNNTSVEQICGKPPVASTKWPPVLRAALDDYMFTATYTFYSCNETISNVTMSKAPAKQENSSTTSDSTSPYTTMTSQMETIKSSTPEMTSQTTKQGVVCKPGKVSELTSMTTFWVAIVLAVLLLIACCIILGLLIKTRRQAEKGKTAIRSNPSAEGNAYEPEDTYTVAQPNGEPELYQTTSAGATNNDQVYSQLERK